jgi:hypothetical protein
MEFRPSIHGWPFGVLPSPDPSTMGLGATPDPDPGLAGGMCWAALDRYLQGVRIAPDQARPEPGDPLHAEFMRRQAAALSGVWSRVREWQDRPDSGWTSMVPFRAPGGGDVASLTRRGWRSIRARLDAGEPVLLVLLLDVDGYRRPTAVVHVLVTAWRRTGARITLSIYDPAHPGVDDLQLAFSRTGPLDALLAGTRRVRGFFHVPYDRTRFGGVRAESFADRSVIGLNRKVKGGVAPLAHDGGLAVIARDRDGGLLHFRRARRGSWEGANVTERQELGSFELHSDPVVAAAGPSVHVFALGYVGDLLHFQLGRRWKASNLTDQKRAGARFRLWTDPVPAVGPLWRMSVLGADADGGLVHYHGRPFLGWRAEQVPGEPIAGPPLAVWRENVLHVLGVSPDGHLLHWERSGEAWTATDLTGLPDGLSLRVTGRPVLHASDDAITVAAADPNGRLVAFRNEGRGWTQSVLAEGISGSPVATVGPAGLHLFALRDGGGLLHAWSPRSWRSEDVLAGRPGLPDVPLAGDLAAWGSERELRVFGRNGGDLWLMAWRPDSDWTAVRLGDRVGVEEHHRAADDPVLVADRNGRPHVFFTDGEGTVQHVELVDGRTGGNPWQAAAVAEAMDLEDADEVEAPAGEAMAAESEEWEPWAGDDDIDDVVDDAAPPEEATPEEPAPVEAAAEAPEAPSPVPVRHWPEDAEPAVETPMPGSEEDPETEDDASDAAEPAAETGSRTTDIEPMDLTLMGNWPPASPSLRRRKDRSRAAEKSDRKRREAS